MGLAINARRQYRIALHPPMLLGNEVKYLHEGLQNQQWASGPFVERFEELLAERTGFDCVVAVSSGTDALSLALRAMGVLPNTEVVVPALTFAATANAVRQIGAFPTIIDVEPHYWQMDASRLEAFLEHAHRKGDGRLVNPDTGRVIRAVLPVDLMGHPADDGKLSGLANRFALPYVEDRAESLGSENFSPLPGQSVMACWSFNGNKIVASPGGGAIGIRGNQRGVLAEGARCMRDQGKDRLDPGGHYVRGGNHRMSNLSAAIALAQLEKLAFMMARKRANADYYRQALTGVEGLELMPHAVWCSPNWWLYTVLLPDGMMSKTLAAFAEADIEVRRMFRPLNTLRSFEDCPAYEVDVASQVYDRALSLPSGVGLEAQEREKVVKVLKKALG